MENQNPTISQPIPQQNIPAEQTPPTPPPFTPHNSLNWLKFLTIGVIVLLVVSVIGVSGYLLGTNKNTPTEVATQTTPTLTPTPNPASNAASTTANWKTHTSPEFGFTVKYPEIFKVEVQKGLKDNVFPDSDIPTTQFSYRGPEEGDCKFVNVTVHSFDTEKEMKEWADKYLKRYQSGTLNELPKEYFPYTNSLDKTITGFWVETGSTGGEIKNVFVKRQDKYVEFRTGGCSLGDDYSQHPDVLEIMENMIPTFQFTN